MKLEEMYEKRLLMKQQEQTLNEAFADLFKPKSANVEKFNSTIEGISNLANKYNIKSLIIAVGNAKTNFQNAVLTNVPNKANQISSATAFIANLQSFIKNLASIVTQLPSVKDAIQKNKPGPLANQLGKDVQTFKDYMLKQYQNSTGLLGRVTNFFQRVGNIQELSKTYKFNPQIFVNELLQMTPEQFSNFTKEDIGNVFVPETGGPAATISQPKAAQGPAAKAQPQGAPITQPAQEAKLPDDIAATIKGSTTLITDPSLFNINNFTGKDKAEVRKNLMGLAQVLGIKL
jgi:hypothetical protein